MSRNRKNKRRENHFGKKAASFIDDMYFLEEIKIGNEEALRYVIDKYGGIGSYGSKIDGTPEWLKKGEDAVYSEALGVPVHLWSNDEAQEHQCDTLQFTRFVPLW